MESGLCCDYCLEAGFAASVDSVVWPHTKRRYNVHQLMAENCTCTSKRNKCWVEKSWLRSSKSFSRGIGYHLALSSDNVQGLWWKNWWEHGHHVDPLQGSQPGQHSRGEGKASNCWSAQSSVSQDRGLKTLQQQLSGKGVRKRIEAA